MDSDEGLDLLSERLDHYSDRLEFLEAAKDKQASHFKDWLIIVEVIQGALMYLHHA